MGGFGDLLGGLAELFGEGAVEGAVHAASEAAGEPAGDAPRTGGTRYLAGGPRALNVNDI